MLKDWIHILSGNTPEMATAPTPDVGRDNESKALQDGLKSRAAKQRAYLVSRGRCIVTQDSTYRSAAATNVVDTWRDYVSKELPGMKEAYKFLYKDSSNV